MTRIYHSESLALHTEIKLSETASHHVSKVMRLNVGDSVNVFNPSGEYTAEISEVAKKSVSVKLIQKLDTHTESSCHTTLLQAVTRRERMDYSIQKATELGVTVIQPIMTEHCVVKLDAKKSEKRIQHWQGIARHATEQSGRLQIPEIKPILSFSEAIEKSDSNSLNLIFALAASKPFSQIEGNHTHVNIALGPVGGFSDKEVNLALKHGFQGIKFGPRVLRAETATVAALTAIQMRWGDLS